MATQNPDMPIRPSGERTMADAEAATPGLLHDTDLPRASERTSPITRSIIGTFAVGLGIASTIWGVFGMIATEAADDGNDFMAAVATVVGGLCFVLAGVFIFRNRLIPSAIFTAVAVACGIVSSVVM